MDALIWDAPSTMTLRERDVPEPAAGEVVVEVAYAGICGSELGGYLGHNKLRVPPLVMGHEFAGTISALGEGVDARFAVGQRVTCNPMLACGACPHCRAGRPHLCVSRALVGAHRPGAFARSVALPQASIWPLPEGMSLRDAALVEPVAVATRIGALAGAMEGMTALVVGAGPIGLLAIQALRDRGAARVFACDRDPDRAAMAHDLGAELVGADGADLSPAVLATTDGLGAELVVDAVGSAETRAQCVAATRAGGTLILSGLHEETGAFPAADVIRREITVQGAFCYTTEDFRAAIEGVAAGRMRLDPWIVEAPLKDGGAWFDRLIAAPGNVSKVLLVP